VLFCDLDGFKRVNDVGGHAAGDAVLVEVANRLLQAVREHDTVARVGGDEFVLIIEHLSAAAGRPSDGGDQIAREDRMVSVAIANRVVEALRAPILIEGIQHDVSVSIGITYPDLNEDIRPAPTAAEILREADAAMYHAKRQGKDRVEIYREELGVHTAPRSPNSLSP
jgi:diguanylate cyclase (GGDEF)-like protein